nr:carbohydrate binding family 6 [Colletotrichum truncatum]KAF6787423.1 carbohydrate binding family 6 [Colletotrichum truncatum]
MRTFGVAVIASLSTTVVHAQKAHVPQIKDFTLAWADDFVGRRGTLPDPRTWIVDVGTSYPNGPPNWGTWEQQTYTNSPNNLNVTGEGTLRITALKSTAGAWTSARIESRQTFMARPGKKMRIQASLKLPSLGSQGVGYWAAFWTLGADYRGNYWNWPEVGEIDIVENVNSLNRLWWVLHCGTQPGGVCNEPSGLGNSKACPAFAPCPGVFRTYAIEIDRSKSTEALRWYVDGALVHTVSQTQLPASVWKQTVQKPHFILLNLAIGGNFPDAIYGSKTPLPNTASGGTLEAQYIAVYNSR